MFWKYNSLSTSQIDTLLDRIAASKAAVSAVVESGSGQEESSSNQSENPTAVAVAEEDDKKNVLNDSNSTTSPDKSLSTPTLKDILEQDDVIQECKNQNRKLVEYLCQPEILSELISLITTEPSTELEEHSRFHLPNVAAEILTCEVAQINEAISSDEALLSKLYSFMEREPPLNPLLASFFSKAFGVLITRKSEQNWYNYQYNCIQVFEFLKKKDLVSDVLRHIGTSAISDLILRLITCVEGTDIKQNLLEWLNEKRLVQSIISLLDTNHTRDTHDNSSRLLIEILRVSRDGQYVPANERCEDPILTTLEDPATIHQLLDVIFKQQSTEGPVIKSESSLVNGMLVLLTLLESRKPQQPASAMAPSNIYSASTFNSAASDTDSMSPEEVEKQQRILDATIRAIIPRIKDFTELLVNPPEKGPIKTTAGILDPPLGYTRLNYAKLVNTLLSTNDMAVNEALAEHRTLDILLDLFFKYSLNNFLHSQVEQCISHVFEWKEPSKLNVTAVSTTPPTVPTSPKSNEEGAGTNEEDLANKMDTDSSSTTVTPTETLEKTAESKEFSENMIVESNNSKAIVNPLLEHLFLNCHLIERILDAWEDNDNGENKTGHQRKGYMGHLTEIANIIVAQQEKNETQKEFISNQFNKLAEDTRERWGNFVTGKLSAMNAKNVVVSASNFSNAMSNSEDDDADFRDLTFPQESALQQMYSDYQMQQVSEHFIDSFGFGAEDINDEESSTSAKRFTTINFGLDEDDFEKNESRDAMFESVCNARNREDDDDIEEEEGDDMWSDKTKDIDFGMKEEKKDRHNSSDEEEEDEEEAKKKRKMEVEDDEWSKLSQNVSQKQSPSVVVAMDTGNPWDGPEAVAAETSIGSSVADDSKEEVRSSTPPVGGWADFGELNDSKDEMATNDNETTSLT